MPSFLAINRRENHESEMRNNDSRMPATLCLGIHGGSQRQQLLHNAHRGALLHGDVQHRVAPAALTAGHAEV